MSTAATERIALGVRESAKAVGISHMLLYRAIKSGDLKSARIGKRRVIRPEWLTAWLEKRASA